MQQLDKFVLPLAMMKQFVTCLGGQNDDMTLKEACYDQDTCDPISKDIFVYWCNFCTAIKKSDWIEWDCHILCQLDGGQQQAYSSTELPIL